MYVAAAKKQENQRGTRETNNQTSPKRREELMEEQNRINQEKDRNKKQAVTGREKVEDGGLGRREHKKKLPPNFNLWR